MGATAYSLFVLPAFSFSSRALGSGAADYCHNTLPNPCVSFHRPLSISLSPSLSLWFKGPGTFSSCNNLLFLLLFLPQWPFHFWFQFLVLHNMIMNAFKATFILFTYQFDVDIELFLFEGLSRTRIFRKEPLWHWTECRFCFFQIVNRALSQYFCPSLKP